VYCGAWAGEAWCTVVLGLGKHGVRWGSMVYGGAWAGEASCTVVLVLVNSFLFCVTDRLASMHVCSKMDLLFTAWPAIRKQTEDRRQRVDEQVHELICCIAV